MLPELAKHSEKLAYFYAIINEGSLQATSRKLGISASGLSYTLKELEKVCQATLLKRSKKGIEPTVAGQKLYQLCRTVYRDMEQTLLQMQDSKHQELHRVRIGTFSSIAVYFWPTFMQELGEESHLSMSLTTGRSRHIMEQLIKKEIDVAIVVEALANPLLVRHELYTDTFSFYASTELSTRKTQDCAIFYIPDAEDQDKKSLQQHLRGLDVKFKEECAIDSFEVIAQFVKVGAGVGILPNRVAATLGKGVKRLTGKGLAQNFGRHRFYLSYRNDLDLSQKDLDLMMTAASKAVRKMI